MRERKLIAERGVKKAYEQGNRIPTMKDDLKNTA